MFQRNFQSYPPCAGVRVPREAVHPTPAAKATSCRTLSWFSRLLTSASTIISTRHAHNTNTTTRCVIRSLKGRGLLLEGKRNDSLPTNLSRNQSINRTKDFFLVCLISPSIKHQGIKHQAWGIKPEATSTEPPRIKHKVLDWDGRSNPPLHRNTRLHRKSGNVDPTPKKTCVWYEIWCPSNFSTFYLNRSSFFVVPRPTHHHHHHPRQPLTRRNLATLSMC